MYIRYKYNVFPKEIRSRIVRECCLRLKLDYYRPGVRRLPMDIMIYNRLTTLATGTEHVQNFSEMLKYFNFTRETDRRTVFDTISSGQKTRAISVNFSPIRVPTPVDGEIKKKKMLIPKAPRNK